ncbi:MAG: IspD/TarI family cytidylyltransferase [Verrucomicrobia bacterium]|nr:IspD/TarI family cytidylyltransferase [Verrucomicrobiota bacterium]MDA1068833.1 IspD/TarI family cytidylyltransferase [Verrucomicrobiota bacterium]
MKTAAILLCGGTSNRMQGIALDKVLAELKGRVIFEYSVVAFEKAEVISSYTVIYRDDPQRSVLEDLLVPLTKKPIAWIKGGVERQDSVFNALQSMPEDTEFVMIHDCARPLVKPDSIKQVHEAMLKDNSAVLAHRVVDTIKKLPVGSKSLRLADLTDLDRSRIWAMETPQAFSFKLIRDAYNKLEEEEIRVTDDTAAISHYGYKVTLIENTFPNPKITHPEDLSLAELLLQQRAEED